MRRNASFTALYEWNVLEIGCSSTYRIPSAVHVRITFATNSAMRLWCRTHGWDVSPSGWAAVLPWMLLERKTHQEHGGPSQTLTPFCHGAKNWDIHRKHRNCFYDLSTKPQTGFSLKLYQEAAGRLLGISVGLLGSSWNLPEARRPQGATNHKVDMPFIPFNENAKVLFKC